MFKKIKKLFKPKAVDLESFCYSDIIWNGSVNFIILFSYSNDYCDDAMELLSIINSVDGLIVKSTHSNYEDEVDDFVIKYSRNYIILSGMDNNYADLLFHTNDLSNTFIKNIINHINNNRLVKCGSYKRYLDDRILNINHDNKVETDPHPNDINIKEYNAYVNNLFTVLRNKLPDSFNGYDILSIVRMNDNYLTMDKIFVLDSDRKLYHIISESLGIIFKNTKYEHIRDIMSLPAYCRMDDDALPGDINDVELHDIFKESYERFSGIKDAGIIYEDIDEVIAADEAVYEMVREEVYND